MAVGDRHCRPREGSIAKVTPWGDSYADGGTQVQKLSAAVTAVGPRQRLPRIMTADGSECRGSLSICLHERIARARGQL